MTRKKSKKAKNIHDQQLILDLDDKAAMLRMCECVIGALTPDERYRFFEVWFSMFCDPLEDAA